MPRLGKQNSVHGRAGRSLRSPGHGPTSRHWPPVPYQSVWQQIWRTPLSIEGRAGGPYLGWPPLPLLDTRRYGYGLSNRRIRREKRDAAGRGSFTMTSVFHECG